LAPKAPRGGPSVPSPPAWPRVPIEVKQRRCPGFFFFLFLALKGFFFDYRVRPCPPRK